MKIISKITPLIITMLASFVSSAQVGIGTTTPNTNAALEIESSTQGIFFPRMTTAQRDAITSPAKGLTIFNTDLNCIQTNISATSTANWKCLGISPSTNGTAVVSAYSCSTASAGILKVGTPVSGVTQTITATVSTVGTYSISTTANGVNFAGSGNFASIGAQNIVLTATGTPTAKGSNTYTLNITPNCNFSRYASVTGCYARISASPEVFKDFLCHNLGADISLDPNTPVVGLQGAYTQWGRRGPNTTGDARVDWQTAANTVNFAAAPTTANSGNAAAIAGWSTTAASNNAWLTVGGAKTANDPCPSGYRVPTSTEWIGVNTNNTVSKTGSWTLGNIEYGSALHYGPNVTTKTLSLPATGQRSYSSGTLASRGESGTYCSSTENGAESLIMFFNNFGVNPANNINRTLGYSLRCIEVDNPSTNGTAVVSGYTCNTTSAGTMSTSSAVSGVTQTITATVTTIGSYGITAYANGVTFSATGTFTVTGAQNIVLAATGTPTVLGTNSFTLNTTPNCSFTRTVSLGPLPANITLSSICPYFIASVNDQDYLPYTAPTVSASLATEQAANGVNEATALNIQGILTSTGVTLKIPYTVVTASVSLPAFSQTINVPASYTEDGIARDVTFSYGAASLGVGSGTINATLQAVGGTLNTKKLDLQTGIGNDNLGWLLAQFTYATNSSGGTATFDFRNIAPIPDRNIADANHRMFYVPVCGADGKKWLSNNLGADYANISKASFNPVAQANSFNDWNAYGSLFQWGRYSDGHELINWSSSSVGSRVNNTTTATKSTTNTPTNSSFITHIVDPFDWRNPQNANLWQGVSGDNNPCPIGYRLPTNAELPSLVSAAGITNMANAASSTLKFSAPGGLTYDTGDFIAGVTGSEGYYWSSTVNGTRSYTRGFTSSVTGIYNSMRAFGLSVRCIAAGNPSTDGTAVVSGYTCNTSSAGNMAAGNAVSGVTQTITATVTTVGTYIITATANGVTFAGSGTFAGIGAQNIVLTASGTPTSATASPYSFTLNTTPNCSFTRAVTPLPANLTLGAISPYFIASINDQDYMPYTAPTAAASIATAQAANGTNETFTLNVQGALTTTGVTLKIPYTVSSGTVSLPAFSQTINVPASYTEDGIARDVTFSYGATSLTGSGTISATLQAVGGTLNAKKLDIQTGIGNDYLGWLLAQFTYATNSSGGTSNFDFRNIAAVPDRNIADVSHVMFYMPVLGADGKTWLNNNLGADYANTTNGAFNPATQASSSTDANAYGSLFQWGRYADGHEFRNSGNTAGPIATPWTSTNFITTSTAPNDWRTPQDGNLWQGVNGTNNPCPNGYRLPTETELANQRNSWSAGNSTGALASPLKLTMAGNRVGVNSSINNVGISGSYWSSTVSSSNSRDIFFNSGNAMFSDNRADGFSVRCIKD